MRSGSVRLGVGVQPFLSIYTYTGSRCAIAAVTVMFIGVTYLPLHYASG